MSLQEKPAMPRRVYATVSFALALAGLCLVPGRAVAQLTLGEAVEQPGLAWTSGGDAQWAPQTAVTHDGVDAARSGDLTSISTDSSSWIQTTVTRPGTLRWWWYAEPCGIDTLTLQVDGVPRVYWASSDSAWVQQALFLDGAVPSSVVRWVYSRRPPCSTYGQALEGGVLDQVEYLPGSGEFFTVPTVAGPVAAGIGRAGTYTARAVAADGYPVEYRFQWDEETPTDWGASASRSRAWATTGPHTVRAWVRCSAHPTSVSEVSADHLVQVYDIPLGTALDAPAQAWSTGGDALWFGEGLATHDGADAAQTEPLAASQSAWVETAVSGPGVATFWWKVSSEEYADYLSFLVDGVLADRISGEVGWEGGLEQRHDLGPGAHTLRWVYAKDAQDDAGGDRAWLDQFSFVPETVATPAVSGPGFAIAGMPDDYTAAGAVDSSGHEVVFEFSFAGVPAGTWGPATRSHAFAVGGTHEVRVRARCSAHPEVVSAWSEPLAVTVEGIAPPARPAGATQTWVGFQTYESAGTASSAGHALEYQFSFGGDERSWLAQPATGYGWESGGARQVLVRARCREHTAALSAWSEPLGVRVLSSLRDTFTDGTAKGDPHWSVLSGAFAAVASAADPGRGRRWVSAPGRTSLALLRPVTSFSTGRITTLVKLVESPGTVPMAEVLFQVRQSGAPAYWRCVRVTRDRIVLAEVGDIHGDGRTGTLATRMRPFAPGRWYRLQIDLRRDRRIQVRVDKETVPALSVTVPMSFYSRVGVRSRGARAMWDDFLVQDSSVLTAP